MSEGKPRADADADLVEAPFLDDEERAEVAWLVARERKDDPAAPAPSPAIARDHAELEDLLGSLPAGAPDDSWHDQVLKQAAAAAAASAGAASAAASPAAVASAAAPSLPPRRRRTYRWVAGGALAAAAAMIAVVLLRPGPRPRAGELEISIRRGDQVRGGAEEAAVGDRLIIRARPRGIGDLRVYRADGALVARCPGGPGCVSSAHGEHAIELRLDAPVPHHVILVDGLARELPGGTLDAHLDAARAANARIVPSRRIAVH